MSKEDLKIVLEEYRTWWLAPSGSTEEQVSFSSWRRAVERIKDANNAEALSLISYVGLKTEQKGYDRK